MNPWRAGIGWIGRAGGRVWIGQWTRSAESGAVHRAAVRSRLDRTLPRRRTRTTERSCVVARPAAQVGLTGQAAAGISAPATGTSAARAFRLQQDLGV